MTTTTLRRLASGPVLALAMSLLCACATHPAGPITTQDLAAAQSFRPFTVYWVGRSFDGVPLTAADTRQDYDATVGERVYYGNCDKPKSILSTTGCQLPLEIATVNYRAINSRGNEGLGTRTNEVIRGVPAVVFDSGRSIQLYTGRLAIDIYADGAARALAAARAVVPMNRPDTPAADRLVQPKFRKDVDPHLLAIAAQLSPAKRSKTS
ncbi:MAG TPA: hypothetical protein VHW26_11225 [Solirubrobacteraceae bacterium]|jgi:hypothetical protein|nr:hypothetical protein [Solirubrobacteraceae bacterium]